MAPSDGIYGGREGPYRRLPAGGTHERNGLVLSYIASDASARVRFGAPVAMSRPAAYFAPFAGCGIREQLAMTVSNHNGTKVWPLSPEDGSTG